MKPNKQEEFISIFKEGLKLFEVQALSLYFKDSDKPHFVLNEMYEVVEKVSNLLKAGVDCDTITPSTRLICLVAIYDKAEKVEKFISNK